MTTVAERIQKERETRKWSYQKLGDHLGVTKSTAHGWATGDIKPDLKNLRKIAKRLRLRLADLVASAMGAA